MKTDMMAQKQTEFLALAGTAFQRMFGTDGQNGLVTFTQREQRACEVADELARWLMGEHVAQDPAGNAGVGQDCPICQRPLEEDPSRPSSEPRALMTRRGQIGYSRVGSRCPHCRKIFFPPG